MALGGGDRFRRCLVRCMHPASLGKARRGGARE
jgi:hypothetical protein